VLNAVKGIVNNKDTLTRHKAFIHSKGIIGEKMENETKEEVD